MKKREVFWIILFLISFISAASISEDLHLNIQTTNASGSVLTGTFDFDFNISTTADCAAANVLYTNSTTLTTDSRGVISYYLTDVSLNYSEQYWLCYYRNGTLINSSKIARTPYTFRARNITLSGVEVDSNLSMKGYNISNVNYGFFDYLGSLITRITKLFVIDIDFSGQINGSGNITTAGNVSADYFFGGGSFLNVNDSDFFDGYDSSYFFPLNTSVSGDFSFNGGWENDGVSIIDGNIYAQVGYFYNITSLNVTKQDLTINETLTIVKNLTVDTDTFFVDGDSDRVGIGTTSPQQTFNVIGQGNITGNVWINNVNASIWLYNQSSPYDSFNYNQTIGSLVYINAGDVNLQSNISAVNTSLIDRFKDFNYNMTDGSYNISYQNYAYNMSDGSYNTTYADYAYNETYTLGTYNATYHGLNISYNKFWYNQSTPYDDFNYNMTGNFNYNQTLWNQSGSNIFPKDLDYKVGIGTTSPSQPLSIAHTAPYVMWNETDQTPAVEWYAGGFNGNFRILNSSLSTILHLEKSGEVGIGTTSPSQELEVFTSSIGGGIMINSSGINSPSLKLTNGTASPVIGLALQSGHYSTDATPGDMVIRNDDNDIIFSTTSSGDYSAELFIEAGGKVGIGTTSPDYDLDIESSSSLARIYSTGADASASLLLQNDVQRWDVEVGGGDNDKFRIEDNTGGTVPVRIEPATPTNTLFLDSAGYVGIGTSSPKRKLEIEDSISLPLELTRPDSAAGTGVGIRFTTDEGFVDMFGMGAGAIYIDGDVGIGTDSPATDLQVNGYIEADRIGIGDTSPEVELDIETVSPQISMLPTGDGTGAVNMELGAGRAGSGYAYIDLTGDTVHNDYGLRILRGPDGENAASQITHKGTGDFLISSINESDIRIRTNSTYRIMIKGDTGNVGIGISDPGEPLQVLTDSGGEAIAIEENSGGEQWEIGVDSLGDLNFQDSGSSVVTFEDGGEVGIGTATPDAPLTIVKSGGAARDFIHIRESTDAADLVLRYSDSNTYSFYTEIGAGGNHIMSFDGDGNVGIGTTTPDTKLEVNGVANITGGIVTDNVVIKTKVIEVGAWNMDADDYVSVSHGLATHTDIRSVSCWVSQDPGTGDSLRNLESVAYSSGAVAGGISHASTTEIILNRVSAGQFDTNVYDNATMNRGWITITYEA